MISATMQIEGVEYIKWPMFFEMRLIIMMLSLRSWKWIRLCIFG